MSNVTAIRGGAVPVREVNPELVEMLEELIAQARAGEITDMAGAVVFYDGYASPVACVNRSNYSFVGALTAVQSGIINAMGE